MQIDSKLKLKAMNSSISTDFSTTSWSLGVESLQWSWRKRAARSWFSWFSVCMSSLYFLHCDRVPGHNSFRVSDVDIFQGTEMLPSTWAQRTCTCVEWCVQLKHVCLIYTGISKWQPIVCLWHPHGARKKKITLQQGLRAVLSMCLCTCMSVWNLYQRHASALSQRRFGYRC